MHEAQTGPDHCKTAIENIAFPSPEDFIFELSDDEFLNLRSQIGTSSWGGVTGKLICLFSDKTTFLISDNRWYPVCTDGIVRIQNTDRYDDRDDIRVNLIEMAQNGYMYTRETDKEDSIKILHIWDSRRDPKYITPALQNAGWDLHKHIRSFSADICRVKQFR